MKKCKTCGKNCDGDYCFHHKPRKALKTISLIDKIKPFQEDFNKHMEMSNFFLEIWSKRVHKSEISEDYLGKEALSIFFHHILAKEKYPQARLDEENIVLLTLDEHTNVENDMYKYEEVNKRRDYLKTKYNL